MPDLKQNEPNMNLLDLCLELTVYGMLLIVLIPLTAHHLHADDLAMVTCFLACVFAFKVLFPIRQLGKYFWGRTLALVVCGLFAWGLIRSAENTRTGWFRFHVVHNRVQQLVSNAPAYVITANERGEITGASDNIGLLVGWTRREILGKHIHEFMRPGPAARHDVAFAEAVRILKAGRASPKAGWTLQGVLTVAIRHKDGKTVPVQAYAGGIRWSQDVQFSGDIDIFAIFVPITEARAREGPTTIPAETPLKTAPMPPESPILAPPTAR